MSVLHLTIGKKTSLADLEKQHKVLVILFVTGLLFKLYAFPQEISEPPDFGDESHGLIMFILVILKR